MLENKVVETISSLMDASLKMCVSQQDFAESFSDETKIFFAFEIVCEM